MSINYRIPKKRPAPARKLSRNIIEKLKCPLDSRCLEVKDGEIRGLALLVTGTGTKSWYFTRKVQGKLMRKNLGEWPIASPGAARNNTLAWLQGSNSDDLAPERQKIPAVNEFLAYEERTVWWGKPKPTTKPMLIWKLSRGVRLWLALWQIQEPMNLLSL